MLKHNSFNSLALKAWSETKVPESEKLTHIKGDDTWVRDMDQVVRWCRLVPIKAKLSFTLLEYVRSTLVDQYAGPNHKLLAVSAPVDFDFELLVVERAIMLLNGVMATRFSSPDTEAESAALGQADLTYNQMLTFTYRHDQKTLIASNISLLHVLADLLGRLKTSASPRADIMKRVAPFEADEDVVANRLKLRHYIGDILRNQAALKQATSAP
uniref:Rubisco LSMT substrate-binding domain-containing protein n=1 Tax=Euplotes harpa TaxID=151035 RepID=A0A7S3N8T1_9SPIT|mmetsp:Transcript_19113/g.22033  ORF Transcript_19113/g.22033 Transcript_19113/m.22033 type:complete len:213 (+) Transcript_19113:1295-1933(+)